MAITRTQIAKQLLANGGRTGFQGGGKDLGTASSKDFGFGNREARDEGAIRERMENIGKDRPSVVVPPPKPPKPKKTIKEKFVPPAVKFLNFLGDKLSTSKLGMLNNALQRQNYLRTLSPEEQVEVLEDLAKIGIGTDNPMGITRNIDRGMDDGFLGTGIGGGKFITDPDFGGPEAKAVLGEGYTDYLKEQSERFTPDDKDGPQDPCLGPNPPAYCFVGIRSAAPVVEDTKYVNPLSKLTPRIAGTQFAAAGGGIANLDDMDREAFLLGGIAKGLKKAVRGVKKLAKSPIGKAAILGAVGFGLGSKGALGSFFGKGSFNPFLRTVAGDTAFSGLGSILSKAGLVSKAGLPTFMGGITLASILPLLAGKTDDEKEDILKDYYASQELTPSTTKRQAGSEFDFYNYNLAEGGRIGYSSGSDDKKNKPKKNKLPIEIPVSPLDERINELYEKLNLKEGLKALEKRKLNSKGGSQKEPVAKKVMPLLDMDGMEKDYREEGGFVPIGRMEKADDVPARLSKNEFVFTADAVRNAGEGDVDKGAEVMYNMMKNLEAGGEVSEESQGLDGARKMFQTSQRLEEVL